MLATLKNYHQSPRKVRLVADLIRGKRIAEAQAALLFLDKKSSSAMKKLLDSALANARNSGVSTDELVVKRASVDKGVVMKRSRPFSRGRSGIIRKTMSIISLELGMPDKKNATKKQRSPKPLAVKH